MVSITLPCWGVIGAASVVFALAAWVSIAGTASSFLRAGAGDSADPAQIAVGVYQAAGIALVGTILGFAGLVLGLTVAARRPAP